MENSRFQRWHLLLIIIDIVNFFGSPVLCNIIQTTYIQISWNYNILGKLSLVSYISKKNFCCQKKKHSLFPVVSAQLEKVNNRQLFSFITQHGSNMEAAQIWIQVYLEKQASIAFM